MKLSQKLPAFFVLILVMLLSSLGMTQNDPTNRAKNRTKWKINRKADKKVDDAVDDAFDAVGGIFKKKNKTRPQETEEGETEEEIVIETNEESVQVSDTESEVTIDYAEDESWEFVPNSFIGSFEMDFSGYKKGKPIKDGQGIFYYSLDESRIAMRIEIKNTKQASPRMIYNLQDRSVTTVVEDKGKKQAMIMPMPKVRTKVKSEDWVDGEYTVTPTGNEKMIEGYLCKEYRISSEKREGTVWITDEIEIDMSGLTNMVKVESSGGRNLADPEKIYGLKGAMLESHTKDIKKDETYDIYIRNIRIGSVDPMAFDISDCEVMDMRRMMGK